MNARNFVYNLLGLGLPLIVALVAIPVLIRALGVEQFGILTIIWAVVSYFGLLDLGLGRAVTQQVATCMAGGDEERLRRIVGTSSALMLGLGVIAGLIMLATAGVLARELTSASDPAVVTRAFWWMALAMPAVVLTSGYRGILEALGRFGLVNVIRLPMGIFTYAGPMLAVWLGYGDLATIAAVLCVGRILAFAVHASCAYQAMPRAARAAAYDSSLIAPLLSMGGWITVTNVVSPIMNYTDRFFLGIAMSASAVAYYATPQELVMRLGIIPSAITAVLFPIFAAQSIGALTGRLTGQMWRYTAVIFVMLVPFTAALVIFAEPLLSLWISREFAAQATVMLQIMAVAALFSGLAQVPFTMLQARAKAAQTAALHLIELPLYLGLLWALVTNDGVIGAALAWLFRIGVDMIALYYLCLRDLRKSAQATPDPADPGLGDLVT